MQFIAACQREVLGKSLTFLEGWIRKSEAHDGIIQIIIGYLQRWVNNKADMNMLLNSHVKLE